MFHMNATTSWTTVIVLLMLVAAFVWFMRQLRARAEWDRAEREAQARRAQMAIVAPTAADSDESADTETARYLALVSDLPRTPEPALYDWQKQGI